MASAQLTTKACTMFLIKGNHANVTKDLYCIASVMRVLRLKLYSCTPLHCVLAEAAICFHESQTQCIAM